MNVLRRASLAWKVLAGAERKAFNMGDGFIRGVGELLTGGTTDWNNSAFVACLNTLTTSFLEAPLMVTREGGKDPERIPNHRLTTMLKRPNPFMTGREMMRAVMQDRAIDGNGYIRLVFNGSKTHLVELWYVPYWALEPVTNPGDPFISYYRYTPKGLPQTPIPLDEIIHFRWGNDPQDARKGLSPVKTLLKELKADTEAALYTFYTLKNPAPGLLLVPGKEVDLSDDQQKSIKETIEKMATGSNRGRIVALNAEMALTQFGHSPKDVDPSALRSIPEQRISAVLGVPAIVAGLGAGLDAATYSNFEQAREAFTENTLVPLWTDIADTLDMTLLPRFDGESVKLMGGGSGIADSLQDTVLYDLSKVRALQEGEDKRRSRLREDWKADGVTHGEWRKAIGYDEDAKRKDSYYSELVGVAPVDAAKEALVKAVIAETQKNRELLEGMHTDDLLEDD